MKGKAYRQRSPSRVRRDHIDRTVASLNKLAGSRHTRIKVKYFGEAARMEIFGKVSHNVTTGGFIVYDAFSFATGSNVDAK